MKLLTGITEKSSKGLKSFAVLLDPDKLDHDKAAKMARAGKENNIDYFFVGGSLLLRNNLDEVISGIRENSDIPVVIFPGSNMQISSAADGILLLSLISGRNPEYLIGQHVVAAPLLKNSGIEIIPTGYILVDCGNKTTVAYISNTTPVPYEKPEVAACTAMAGEMLGLRMIYLDGGSGAEKPVSSEMIRMVKSATDVPVIVGGGIRKPGDALNALNAGADIIVVGNGIEKQSSLLVEISDTVASFNKKSLITDKK